MLILRACIHTYGGSWGGQGICVVRIGKMSDNIYSLPEEAMLSKHKLSLSGLRSPVFLFICLEGIVVYWIHLCMFSVYYVLFVGWLGMISLALLTDIVRVSLCAWIQPPLLNAMCAPPITFMSIYEWRVFVLVFPGSVAWMLCISIVLWLGGFSMWH